MARCARIKADGERCRLGAIEGSEWCFNHDPAKAEERSRNARKGGRTGGRGRNRLAAAQQIHREVRAVIGGVLGGRIERRVGAVALQGFNVLLRAVELERRLVEADELEARIDALERTQEEERRWAG